MQAIRVVTGLAAVVMGLAIVYGMVSGDFGAEGGEILDLAWGRVMLIDLYVGLALFAGWVLIRERSLVVVPWLVAFVLLGNFATALYAFVAAFRSDSVGEFLTGSDSATTQRFPDRP